MHKVGSRLVGRLGAALSMLAPACGPGSDSGAPCPDPQPTFIVTLRAQPGPLPADTSVTVSYGAGEETYSLEEPDAPHEVMFCSARSARAPGGGLGGAAGAAGATNGAPETLQCEIWTEGAAALVVTGGNFPPLEEMLIAEADDCGLRTVRVELLLSHERPEDD